MLFAEHVREAMNSASRNAVLGESEEGEHGGRKGDEEEPCLHPQLLGGNHDLDRFQVVALALREQRVEGAIIKVK